MALMYAKLKSYLPIAVLVFFSCTICAWAITAVMPDTNRTQETLNVNTSNDITNSDINAYNFTGDEFADINHPQNIDLDELNRRLLSEGLDPILPPPKPEINKREPNTPPSHSSPTTENQTSSSEPPPTKATEDAPQMNHPKETVNTPKPDPVISKSVETSISPKNQSKEPVYIPPSHDYCPKPVYPHVAERKGIEGTVILRIKVGANGKPLEVGITSSSGNQMLDRTAVETVNKTWRFNPATKDEIAVESWVEVPVVFKLR